MFIHSFGNSSFVKISSNHLHSQTIRARELTVWEKVHLPSPVSCVTCQVSHVTCQLSYVTKFDKVVRLVGGGSVINRAHPILFLVLLFSQYTSLILKGSLANLPLLYLCKILAIDSMKATPGAPDTYDNPHSLEGYGFLFYDKFFSGIMKSPKTSHLIRIYYYTNFGLSQIIWWINSKHYMW